MYVHLFVCVCALFFLTRYSEVGLLCTQFWGATSSSCGNSRWRWLQLGVHKPSLLTSKSWRDSATGFHKHLFRHPLKLAKMTTVCVKKCFQQVYPNSQSINSLLMVHWIFAQHVRVFPGMIQSIGVSLKAVTQLIQMGQPVQQSSGLWCK